MWEHGFCSLCQSAQVGVGCLRSGRWGFLSIKKKRRKYFLLILPPLPFFSLNDAWRCTVGLKEPELMVLFISSLLEQISWSNKKTSDKRKHYGSLLCFTLRGKPTRARWNRWGEIASLQHFIISEYLSTRARFGWAAGEQMKECGFSSKVSKWSQMGACSWWDSFVVNKGKITDQSCPESKKTLSPWHCITGCKGHSIHTASCLVKSFLIFSREQIFCVRHLCSLLNTRQHLVTPYLDSTQAQLAGCVG